ncbi:Cytochrome P450 [Haloechinothrix alba]|uniref:Cytochrome P450 n=1 Tax=Haloechinothrix alba TaxID=664784 RepID=A0A238YYH9_9PSEU|nr:cytochrome P450 [Haloechinothrix alba]SNR76276.1 Cytochrome P450 [Haloechinothrix alba]
MNGQAHASHPTDEPLFNPFAEGFTDDPYPHYAVLRERAPVYEHPLGFWVLSRHEEVSELLRSGNSVEEHNAAPGPMRDVIAGSYGDRAPRMNGMSILDLDPPAHTRLRRLVAKAFTPRAIEALRPRIRELVDELMEPVIGAGEVDLVRTVAFPLPFAVISEMMGMPRVDVARLRDLTGTLVRSLEPVADPEMLEAIVAADDEVMRMIADIIAWKRRNRGDDLLTALIDAEEDGDSLSDDELVAQVALLFIAGHETTVNLIGGGALALLRHPGQLARLRAEPDLLPTAVEELLRYDSPVQSSRRITVRPHRAAGVEIPEGAFVMAALASANRDERQWGEDADRVRLDRPNPHRHVSFGAGVHHCLGASLARVEAQIALEKLVTRTGDLALTGEVEWNGRINLRGPAHLPVAVR